MFGRKTRTTLSDQVATIIGENSVVKGSINSSSSLRIDGEIEGEVTQDCRVACFVFSFYFL